MSFGYQSLVSTLDYYSSLGCWSLEGCHSMTSMDTGGTSDFQSTRCWSHKLAIKASFPNEYMKSLKFTIEPAWSAIESPLNQHEIPLNSIESPLIQHWIPLTPAAQHKCRFDPSHQLLPRKTSAPRRFQGRLGLAQLHQGRVLGCLKLFWMGMEWQKNRRCHVYSLNIYIYTNIIYTCIHIYIYIS